MTWGRHHKKHNWRAFLSPDEREIIVASDRMSAEIARLRATYDKKFGRQRQKIVNRAIQRAKYSALTGGRQGS